MHCTRDMEGILYMYASCIKAALKGRIRGLNIGH